MVREQAWTFNAESDAPVAARNAIRDFSADLDLSETTLTDVMLCVSEAVTNVVQHAYQDSAKPGPVHIHARLEDGQLRLGVRDEGIGMMPRTDSPGLGLGLPTISSLAGELEIRASDAGTEVLMRFALRAPSGGDGDA